MLRFAKPIKAPALNYSTEAMMAQETVYVPKNTASAYIVLSVPIICLMPSTSERLTALCAILLRNYLLRFRRVGKLLD
jgi:hypothetical protein